MMLARVKLPRARCCFPELFVLGSIVVCQGCAAICHCQLRYDTSIHGVVMGGRMWKLLHIREGGKIGSVITGDRFDLYRE